MLEVADPLQIVVAVLLLVVVLLWPCVYERERCEHARATKQQGSSLTRRRLMILVEVVQWVARCYKAVLCKSWTRRRLLV